MLKTFAFELEIMVSAVSSHWVDHCFKVIIIGDYKVGKTSLLCKYTGQEYRLSQGSSMTVDFCVKMLCRNEKRIKLQLWDFAGQERFRTAVASYYRGALGVLLVYDVTNRQSFQNIGYWYKEMKNNCPENAQAILIGNKCHLMHEREVEPTEGQQLAAHLEIPFYETSPDKSINVNECFDELVECLLGETERLKQMEELKGLSLPVSGQVDTSVDACSCNIL